MGITKKLQKLFGGDWSYCGGRSLYWWCHNTGRSVHRSGIYGVIIEGRKPYRYVYPKYIFFDKNAGDRKLISRKGKIFNTVKGIDKAPAGREDEG